MLEEELSHRIGALPVRSEVVLHEQTPGLEQRDDLGRLVELAGIEEEDLERRTLRKHFPPIAYDELDVLECLEPPSRDRGALRVAFDGDQRPGGGRNRGRAFAECGSGLGAALSRGEYCQQPLDLR